MFSSMFQDLKNCKEPLIIFMNIATQSCERGSSAFTLRYFLCSELCGKYIFLRNLLVNSLCYDFLGLHLTKDPLASQAGKKFLTSDEFYCYICCLYTIGRYYAANEKNTVHVHVPYSKVP